MFSSYHYTINLKVYMNDHYFADMHFCLPQPHLRGVETSLTGKLELGCRFAHLSCTCVLVYLCFTYHLRGILKMTYFIYFFLSVYHLSDVLLTSCRRFCLFLLLHRNRTSLRQWIICLKTNSRFICIRFEKGIQGKVTSNFD